MKNLKLNKLNQISEEMKDVVKGGEAPCCSCGCCYANSGGSSVAANGNENMKYGYHSVISTDCDTPYDQRWTIVCPDES